MWLCLPAKPSSNSATPWPSGESAAKEEQLKGLKEKVGRLETNIAAVQAAAVEEEQKM